MKLNNYEVASSNTNHIKETWDKILDRNAEYNKMQEDQQHEIKLKEMEIQAQKDLVVGVGAIIFFITLISVIIYSYRKSVSKTKNKTVNGIKDKMDILNSLLVEGVITKEEFDIQKDKLINK